MEAMDCQHRSICPERHEPLGRKEVGALKSLGWRALYSGGWRRPDFRLTVGVAISAGAQRGNRTSMRY
jgi:hypothetical protein